MRNYNNEIKLITKLIINYCKPEKIILFGSFARGSFHKDSDIDLFIIKKSSQKRPFRAKEIFEALRGIERTFPLDPIVYTPKEIKDRLSLDDPFVKTILNEGKTIYEQKAKVS